MTTERKWTLETARAMLDEVRGRTEKAVAVVQELLEQRERHAPGSPEHGAVEKRIRARVGDWVREMDALGVEVKGPWLVDFDNGSGYFCWRWPEERLEYFHGYEDGFAGRTRIQ
jgi:hypothetical protein